MLVVAAQCRQAPDRLKAVALVPLQDPAAVEELRRAVRELGCVGVLVPGLVGNQPLHLPKFEPFFAAVAARDVPWADCFRDFFSTHVTMMPFSMDDGRAGLAPARRLLRALPEPARGVPGDRRVVAAVLGLVGGPPRRAGRRSTTSARGASSAATSPTRTCATSWTG